MTGAKMTGAKITGAKMMEAGVGIEPTHRSFAGSCITTLLPSPKLEFFFKKKDKQKLKAQSKNQLQDYKP